MKVTANRNEVELRLLSMCTGAQKIPPTAHIKSADSSPFTLETDEADTPRQVSAYVLNSSAPPFELCVSEISRQNESNITLTKPQSLEPSSKRVMSSEADGSSAFLTLHTEDE